jgi:cyclopropane fatty-acyl-phospholipid synthase-like methyltransferase
VRSLWAGEAFREIMVRRADIRPGHRVLDPGCGRGALALLVKEVQPGVAVTGLDVYERDVARARRWAGRVGSCDTSGRRWPLRSSRASIDLALRDVAPYPMT